VAIIYSDVGDEAMWNRFLDDAGILPRSNPITVKEKVLQVNFELLFPSDAVEKMLVLRREEKEHPELVKRALEHRLPIGLFIVHCVNFEFIA
jgi:hypothetical protein